MSAVPPRHRGAASGMRSTFQNSGMSLSIGIFFSLMIAGLASTLPQTLTSGLTAQGVRPVATQVSHLPPVSTLFAALLGYNPVQNLLSPRVLQHAARAQRGRADRPEFFPHLIEAPFHHGLVIVFTAAAIMSVIGALVSLLRGKQFYYNDDGARAGRRAQRHRPVHGGQPGGSSAGRLGVPAQRRCEPGASGGCRGRCTAPARRRPAGPCAARWRG